MMGIAELIEQLCKTCINTYHAGPLRIEEDARKEEEVLAGGYSYRQVLELVQNGADAILEASEQPGGLHDAARMEVVLHEHHLYVANTGAALSKEGIETLLHSNLSRKRGNQIGRFGLGFKSLLRLGGQLDIFSTSGSLRFDPERCRSEIRHEFKLSDDASTAGLRLAWALQRTEEESDDAILASFQWATTVVRTEIRDASMFSHLHDEVQKFPSPFLLFLPVKVTLDLDAGDGKRRQLKREPDGLDILLHDGDAQSRWRVMELEVHITEEAAKNDATHLHDRKIVPLAWAMPLDAKREEAGRFWAFFPTDTLTRLPGILNAPWKLNSDRNALIPGDWNTALMQEAAKLIAKSLSSLSTESDPGRPLDAFPRQLERQDEPAAPLVNAIWAAIKDVPIIPDAQGTPRLGSKLKRPPLDDQELHEQWRQLAGEEVRARWVHPSCLSGERTSRLTELRDRLRRAGIQGMPQTKTADWFADVASIETESAKSALRLAKALAEKTPSSYWDQERPALSIVPSESGQLLIPSKLVIAPAGVNIPGRETVRQDLANDPETRRILSDVMGVKGLDEQGWQGLLRDGLTEAKRDVRHNENGWRHFWDTLRLVPDHIRDSFLSAHKNEIRLRRQDGAWVLQDEVLLPGTIVSPDDPEESNRGILVDDATHGQDQDVLTAMMVSECPSGTREPGKYNEILAEKSGLLHSWLSAVEDNYRSKLDTSSSPQSGYLRPLSLTLLKGWMLLAQLKGLANARLTKRFMETLGSLGEAVDFGHTTRRNAYPEIQVAHPMRWFIRQHGTFAIGQRAIPLTTVLARLDVIAKVDGWNANALQLDLLTSPVGAPALAKPAKTQIESLWQALFEHLATPDAIANDCLQDLWSAAAADGQVPEKLRTPSGEIPLAEVYATGSANLAQRARTQRMTAITLDAYTLKHWLSNGARNLDELFRPEWNEALSSPVSLETAVPELSEVLSDEARACALCQSVRDLQLVIEKRAQPIPCIQWQGVLHLDPNQLNGLSRSGRLAIILHEASAAGWLRMPLANAQRQIANAQVEANRAHVAAGANLPDRLLRCVGGRSEVLAETLGKSTHKALPEDSSPAQIADLALAMRGPTILRDIQNALNAEGLQPPARWGGDEARTFVAEIGFPEAFAAAPESKREAEEMISGPIRLPDLHDYQEEVIGGLRDLINSGTGRRRAVVSLPTGGGKTRVTVQAAVDLVLKPELGRRTILWIAQTDELCEQAVQSFRQVWLNRGEEGANLRIIRFWSGHRNPAPSADNQPTAVIASIQTLNSRIGTEGLAWLSNPGLVVVDECHHAIAPSYTGLLKWLDAVAPRPGSPAKNEPPIIGLSATPFRGSNDDEENLRLAKRFDQCWLPSDQQGLHERLTKRDFLAVADHEPLKSPSVFPPALIERFNQTANMDSIHFENLLNELNDLLADDDNRNQMLIKTIAASQQQSILFFANSVGHAEEMAARLNLQGIPAAAVSGDTPSSARRYFLARFQRGEIRVLCNRDVLTTGFDAPKTDMVLISRQVLSPVRYMQMVGRGLRGEKNGGTARCRVVTVVDNLGRFSDRHPYHFCAKYFKAAP